MKERGENVMKMTGHKLERNRKETDLNFERCIDFMAELMEKYAHLIPSLLSEQWIEMEVSSYDVRQLSYWVRLPSAMAQLVA